MRTPGRRAPVRQLARTRTVTTNHTTPLGWFGRREPAIGHIGRSTVDAALFAGSGCIAGSALIHLHLWALGYRHVPTIGALFAAQGIAGLVLTVALIAYPGVLTATAGAGYLIASIAALVLSATRGLFGFHDQLDAPWAHTSLTVESAGIVVLVLGVALALQPVQPPSQTTNRIGTPEDNP
jgi:hypothetical protein